METVTVTIASVVKEVDTPVLNSGDAGSTPAARTNDFPLVIITWEDSRQPTGKWQHIEDLELQGVCKIATVGWLLKDEPASKAIAQSVGGLGGDDDCTQVCGIMVIPTSCVISIEKLVEAEQV